MLATTRSNALKVQATIKYTDAPALNVKSTQNGTLRGRLLEYDGSLIEDTLSF